MKVLIVSTSDLQGGAAIAAYRLMHALRESGVQAEMLVRDKQSDSPHVNQIGRKLEKRLHFYRERAGIYLQNRFSRKNLFDVSVADSGISITTHPKFREADIIHLHWINQGMLSLREIEKILESGKKVVWTMHDMWPFTGICHHAGSCTNFERECGMCPYLARPSENDLSNRVFLKKQQIYSKGNISFVACSLWLKNLADRSPLTKNGTVTAIANPIDTASWKPKDKFEIRKRLSLPIDKKIVLFAAANASDRRKGIDYLIEASHILKYKHDDLLFLIAGVGGDEIAAKLALPAHVLGYVSAKNMPELYNAADLFVTPSLQENLPNTIMESMSCGTPCVGFDIGGIPEMITHKETGYVAAYKDAADFAEGIEYVLYGADSETLSAACREFVLKNYASAQIAKQYISLYNSL